MANPSRSNGKELNSSTQYQTTNFLSFSRIPQSYTLKVSKDGKDYEDQIVVDTRKNTETSHLRRASSGKDAGDIIYDFQRVINFNNKLNK